ncbi:hypothetical protein Tco_0021040, partial [Tanacetum coccineum]
MILMITFTIFQLTTSQNDSVSSATCPLNFNILRRMLNTTASGFNEHTYCTSAKLSIQVAVAEYLRRTNSFVLSLNTSDLCWNNASQILAENYLPNLAVRHNCGFKKDLMSVSGCMNITTRQQFESFISNKALSDFVNTCSQPLDDDTSCASCTVAISNLQANYFNGPSVGNMTGCGAFPVMYAAAFINPLGISDR